MRASDALAVSTVRSLAAILMFLGLFRIFAGQAMGDADASRWPGAILIALSILCTFVAVWLERRWA